MPRTKLHFVAFVLFVLVSILIPVASTVIAQDTSSTYYVTGTSRVNARATASTSATIILRLSPGSTVTVVGETTGDTVRGSNIWYQVLVNDQTAFVHSSLLTTTVPSARGSNSAVATSIPALNPPLPAPAVSNFTCSCSRTCTQMSSCEEAYYQLNTCGCARRDTDHDGVPCENICTGG